MYSIRSAVLGAMSLLLVPAFLQSQGKKSQVRTVPATSVVVFHDRDRPVVREYFTSQRMTVTELPPGIAKKVARGKPLPPGIARKVFPRRAIAHYRPDVDPNIEFLIVGHDMVAMRRGVVVDVMFNVFP